MRVIASLVIAFAMYSRLPTPRVAWTDENRAYVACFFPLIGAVTGAAVWLWLLLCEALSIGALLKGAGGAVIPLWMTGGIHMDGFMDTSDALASWQPKEKKLEILKDSHVGAFAVIHCCGYLMLSAALLSEARSADAAAIGACFVMSRAMSAWALAACPSARPDGMLGSLQSASNRRATKLCSALYAALCVAVWAVWGRWLSALCAATAVAVLLGYRRMAIRRFGGVTGDLAGWLTQVAELACIAAVVMGGRTL